MINKTFRLFISSTFNDFIVEREVLNDKVFPEIDDFCQKKGYNFQLIDLRWGINNESAINQNTLAICLDEVKRCKQLSPKPNFLIMAGERYGWIPLPQKISKHKFEEILSVASDKETKILSKWYLLDENEIGGEYYLKTRTDEYIKNDIWADEELRIHNALTSCVIEKLKYSEEEAKIFISSATEHEIIEGLLSNNDIANNTVAVFRKGFDKKDEDQTRIIDLKNRIVKKMAADNCSENILELEWDDNYIAKFEQEIIDVLKKNISGEIKRLEQKQENNDENNFLSIENDIPVLFERTTEEEYLSDYVYGKKSVPLFLTGDSGSGKTTLLAEFIKKTDIKCFYAFYGADDNSYTLVDAVKSIVDKARFDFSLQGITEVNSRNIAEVLYKTVFSIPGYEDVLIVIDGFDMFHDINNIFQRVFPTNLPKNVRMIISAADRNIIERFSDDSDCFFNMGWFTPQESEKNLSDAMKVRNRHISSGIQNRVISEAISNGTTPLQIKLMTEICSAWHSDDAAVNIPSSSEDIALLHLESMYNKYGHNKELVLYALSLIAAAPFGIMEDEILLLLLRFDSVREHFISEDRYNHKLLKLPFAVWSRLFYDLKGCLTLSRFNGSIVVKFSHNVFFRVLVANFYTYYTQANSKLIEFYANQSNYINAEKYPNARKAYNLSYLLRKNEMIEEMKTLFEDLSYIDSVIKVGNINNLLSDIQYINETIGSSEYLNKLYSCLQNNRNTLLCYKCEFLSCWHKENKNVSIVQSEKNIPDAEQIYFPYSSSSRIRWFNNGEKYAVFNNTYVYICNSKTNSEDCSIFVQPKKYASLSITDLLWINESRIAVITETGNILVYDFSDRIPNIVANIKTKSTFSNIKYIPGSEILLYQDKKKICAFNLQTNQKVYEIKIKRKSELGFYVDDAEDILYLKDSQKTIRAFNIKDGEALNKIKVNSGYGFGGILTYFFNFSINKISDSKWVEQTPHFDSSVAILDGVKNQKLFLHPPRYQEITDVMIDKNIVLFIYSDSIIKIDLNQDYTLKYYYFPGIESVSWIEYDKKLSILTEEGLFLVNLSDFTDYETPAFCHRNFLFSSFYQQLKRLIKNFNWTGNAIKLLTQNMYNYKTFFNIFSTFSKTDPMKIFDQTNKTSNIKATIVKFAADGKKAVAYEQNDAIFIFDKDEKLLFRMENLKLAVNNNILKMEFSPDSQHLLLWRNRSVQIIQINSGKVVLGLNVSLRPVLDVCFKTESTVNIILCDGKTYEFVYEGKIFRSVSDLPKNLIKKVNKKDYFAAYSFYKQSDGDCRSIAYINADMFDIAIMPFQWFKNEHIYNGERNWLYYKNGVFYLNGDMKKPFISDFYDFNQCLQIEQMSDPTSIKSFLREKNNLMSTLIEFGNEYIVLISRRLNSLIVFDLSQMKVISAYRFNGSIIGNRMVDAKTITVVLDRTPYLQKLKINFPDKSTQ